MAKAGRRLGVEERRRRLLELGKKVFSEHAYDQLSTDELARRAGVSKGLLYHYFPSKRDYYVATIREVARELLDDTAPIVGVSFMAKLRHSLANFVSFVEHNDKLYRALVGGGIGADGEVRQILQELRQTSCDRLLEQLGVTESSPRLTVAFFGWIGFVEFACLQWAKDKTFPRDELIDLLQQAIGPAIADVRHPVV